MLYDFKMRNVERGFTPQKSFRNREPAKGISRLFFDRLLFRFFRFG